MTKQFNIELFKGHPIISDGENRILIDTGAPSTIHTSTQLNFCSENFHCTVNYMGLTVSELSKMLGTEITTLLGSDILSKYSILFDYRGHIIQFSEREIEFTGTLMNISNFMGIPIVKLKVDEKELNFFLDTGAQLSYLTESITSKYDSIGQEEDFYPGFGKFQTECHEIPTVAGEHTFIAKYGNLPSILQNTLMLAGTDGIMGFDFFNQFTVVLNLKNNTLKYK